MSALGAWMAGADTLSRTVYRPLAAMFFNGPAPVGWAGRSPSDICATISGMKAQFWDDNGAGCDQLLASSFEAWITVVNFIVIYGVAGVFISKAVAAVWVCFGQPKGSIQYIPIAVPTPRRVHLRRRISLSPSRGRRRVSPRWGQG